MLIKRISQDTVYSGKIFSIEADLLEFPDGRKVSYELVKHNPSVTILPLDTEGMVYLVKQYRLGAGRDLLEFPAGVVENGEDPWACALRETREEIGMASGKLTLLGQAYLIPGYGDELMNFYLAEELTPGPLTPDPDEFLQVEHLAVAELFNLIDKGVITDSKTLAALTLARRYLSDW
jgi:ADP-ribose pyrophosphatase